MTSIKFINFPAYLRMVFYHKRLLIFLKFHRHRHFRLLENLMRNNLLGNQLVLTQQTNYLHQVVVANSFAYMDYNFQLTPLIANLQLYRLKPKNFCRFRL